MDLFFSFGELSTTCGLSVGTKKIAKELPPKMARRPSRKRWRLLRTGLTSLACVAAIVYGRTVYRFVHDVSPKEVWIVAQSGPGRLGNQMFQFASALGVYEHRRRQQQLSNNLRQDLVRFCIDPTNPFPFANIFEGPFVTCPSEILNSIEHLPEKGYGIYTEFDTTSCGGRSTCVFAVGPYLQSYRYLQFAGKSIRSSFRFRSNIHDRAQKILHGVRTNAATAVVGIHVRRGDVEFVPYLRTAPSSFFVHAMRHFVSRLGNDGVAFVLASDDVDWCKSQGTLFNEGVTILETGDAALDLAVLSMTDHMVVSVGTFGWWAAFLGAGDVVYYKDAIVMEHPTNKNQINLNDYYPSIWTGLS